MIQCKKSYNSSFKTFKIKTYGTQIRSLIGRGVFGPAGVYN